MRRKIKSRVGALREEAGLTQVQLAAFVGVTPNTIQNWEKEEGLDQLERYLKLAEILGCEVQELVEFAESNEPEGQTNISFSLEDLRKLRAKWNLKNPSSPTSESSLKKLSKEDDSSKNSFSKLSQEDELERHNESISINNETVESEYQNIDLTSQSSSKQGKKENETVARNKINNKGSS
jgi:transcriptional regulator with XRE-family HTH domain